MRSSSRWLLAFVAGFVDTATFVHLSGLFTAHVTGNFVVFAAALARGIEAEDYVKLGTFPVFVFAVLLGAFLHGTPDPERPKRWTRLLGLESGLMLGAGLGAGGLSMACETIDLGGIDLVFALLLVVAMGLQNAVHRQVPGPMSTVMTGNVTAFTTLLGQRLFARFRNAPTEAAKGNPTALIVAFAVGCVVAALSAQSMGLVVVFLPGLVVAGVAIRERTA